MKGDYVVIALAGFTVGVGIGLLAFFVIRVVVP